MVKKVKHKTHDFRGLINLIFIILQLMNVFFSLALSETGEMVDGMPSPGAIALFFPFYLFFRGFNYKICRWLGYHAEADLAEGVVEPTLYNSGTAFVLPEFRKSTKHYKQKYNQRSRLFQSAFYVGFVFLTWATCYVGLTFMYFFIKMIPFHTEFIDGIIASIVVLVMMGVEWLVTQIYYIYYPDIFKLDVLMVEHGQPVFGYLKNDQSGAETISRVAVSKLPRGVSIRLCEEDDDFESIKATYVTAMKATYKGILPESSLQNINGELLDQDVGFQMDELWEQQMIVTVDDKIIGGCRFIESQSSLFKMHGEIYALYMLPQYNHGSIEKTLLEVTIDKLQDKYQKICVWLYDEDLASQKFYKQLGFQDSGITCSDDGLGKANELKKRALVLIS